MPATTTRRAAPLPPEERRAAVIEAVMPLLLEHGEAVTCRHLAQAAGVSEGTLFNVFTDKDELLAAVLESALDPAPFEQAVSQIDPTQPFQQQLVAATRLLQVRIVDIWRLISALGPRHDPSGRPLTDSPALVVLLAAGQLQLSVTPEEAARLLRALTLSLTHPKLAAEPAEPERIVQVLLHGIGRPA